MSEWLFPLIGLLLGLGIVFFPLFSYRKQEERYSFLHDFPFEMVTNNEQKLVLLALSILFVMASSEGYAANSLITSLPTFYAGMGMEIISLLAFLFVVSFSLENYRMHLGADAVFFLGEIGGDFCFFTGYLLKSGRFINFNLVIAVIMGVEGLLLLISLFFPQLKKWMMLEKSEENGKIIYSRPKVAILVVLEWAFFLGHLINMILLLANGLIYR
jgi:hypothetical protein